MNATEVPTAKTEGTTMLADAINNLHAKFHEFMENFDPKGMTSEQLAPLTNELQELLNCAGNTFDMMLLLEARAVIRETTKVKLPPFVFTYRNYSDNMTHCVFGNDKNMEAFMKKFSGDVYDVKKRKLEPSQNYIFVHRSRSGVPGTSEYTGTMEDYIRKVQEDQNRVMVDAILLD
jgi:predicted HAD superfamily Cof-like phosphohydrolase